MRVDLNTAYTCHVFVSDVIPRILIQTALPQKVYLK